MKPNISHCLYWLCIVFTWTATITGAEGGPLVIVGGGEIPVEIRRTIVEMGGDRETVLAVLPQASGRPDRGKASVEAFTSLGVSEAYIVELDDPQKARVLIKKATAIWFPGGSQAKLYEALKKAEVIDLLRARHGAGIPFAGTSAGAAIMSDKMIPRMPEKPRLTADNTPVIQGLGLAPELIIDQHFVERARMNRLLGAVLDYPDRVGVGISESTAIVVRGHSFSVMGKGSVVVIDARKAKTFKTKVDSLQSGSNIDLHVLKAGQSFQFK